MKEKDWYIVGGPAFGQVLIACKKEGFFRAPAGQLELCWEVLRETQDSEAILENLSQEYFSIILGLMEMGIDFRITYCKGDKTYRKMLSASAGKLGLKLMGFPRNFPPHLVCYPRDMFTVLPGIILVNPEIGRLKIKERSGYRILSSPYGEGGRVLLCGKTMLLSNGLIFEDNCSIHKTELTDFEQNGMKLGFFPLSMSGTFSLAGIGKNFFPSDHSDRVACLINGEDQKLHLVIDPNIFTVENTLITRTPKESLEKIKIICQKLGIEVHCPRKIEVPYALNLIQFPDNRILMTSGDDSITAVIAEIVGEEKITQTEVPIRYFPVYTRAGIRCLVNKAPPPLFKSNTLVS